MQRAEDRSHRRQDGPWDEFFGPPVRKQFNPSTRDTTAQIIRTALRAGVEPTNSNPKVAALPLQDENLQMDIAVEDLEELPQVPEHS